MGVYCYDCGQEAINLNVTFLTFIKEFLSNLISVDSKLLITFKNLLMRAGFLSKEYFNGKRTKYTLPSRIYLFASILTLLIFSLFSQESTRYMKFYGNNLGFIMATNEDGSGFRTVMGITHEHMNNSKKLWGAIDSTPLEINYISFIPKVFFCLFPLFAFLLKCFYWNRLYVNHLILVLHNHSFLFIISSLIYIINIILASFGFSFLNIYTVVIILTLYFIYIYFSALKFYCQSYFKTFYKTTLLSISYFFIFIFSNVVIAKLFFLFPTIFK
tara:strand:+ start:89 stop:904 length:816 start_codon:yes stop_codon:yes gene_type:complete